MKATDRFKHLVLLMLVVTLPFSISHAVDIDTSQNQERVAEILPALGIFETFGRWNDVVKLGYNPAGAPDAFADTELFFELLTESAQRWEKVSGIRFEILPVGNYINDKNGPLAEMDRIVSITWVETDDSFAGRAGPRRGSYGGQLKHSPYVDGSIELRSNTTWSGSIRLTYVLVHEIGHLIGLGHSENPQSLMFANPYNSLQHPTEDDIRAVQTLYGPPSSPLDASQPVTAWQYQAPSLGSNSISQVRPGLVRRYDLASDAKTQYLFKPNQVNSIYGKGVMLVLNTDRTKSVTKIDSTTPDGSYLLIYAPVGNLNSTETISLDARIILVNPLGYVNYDRAWNYSCEARFACDTNQALNWNRSIKDVPGEWTIYVIENPETHQNPELLYKTTFEVLGDSKPIFSINYLSAGETALVNNRITESTPNDEFLRVYYQLNNNWNPDRIERKLELVLTDPNGYIYSKTNSVRSCSAVRSCGSWISSQQSTKVLKTLPGKWTIYINDTDTNETLHKMEFVVDTKPVFNKSPTARVELAPTEFAKQIQVRIFAEDTEGDAISINFVGIDQTAEQLSTSGVSQWRVLNFDQLGSHSVFIIVNDNSERYAGCCGPGSAAGSGFQTLIRLDISLPITSTSTIKVVSSSVVANQNTINNMLTLSAPRAAIFPDRAELLALYSATNGASWTNKTGWLGEPGTECNWHGISCLNKRVTRISLSNNNLTGTIPASIGSLTELTFLNLENNKLTGAIPRELGSLSNLTWLAINNNQLTGTIPPELGSLSKLTWLALARNPLSGTIPASIGSLSNLTFLHLYNNNLTGTIPPELGSLSNLISLLLSTNQLTGTIPPELGSLSKLSSLYIYNNQLTGTIPASIGSLSNLTSLLLSTNQLTGTIPQSVIDLPKLITLHLDGNFLTGLIPTRSASLSPLRGFSFSNNPGLFAVVLNVPPSVSIVGGSRTIADTNSAAGESVALTATATDSDGTIASTQWLVAGQIVATGTSATLALPDGATIVTFRATDNSGAATSTTAAITVQNLAQTNPLWLGTFNTIPAPSGFQLDFNSIGQIVLSRQQLHSCVRIFANGTPSTVDGMSNIEVTFKIVSLDAGIIRLIGARDYKTNSGGQANNQAAQLDCSGSFESSTGEYRDVIKLGDQIFNAIFKLTNETQLEFILTGGTEIFAK